jgi:hypothetical protein
LIRNRCLASEGLRHDLDPSLADGLGFPRQMKLDAFNHLPPIECSRQTDVSRRLRGVPNTKSHAD